MKLRDLINNVDRSKANADYVSLDGMANEFDLSLDFLPEDRHQIRAYWLTKWLCTDTWVGLRVYGFETDEGFKPLAVSHQEGRKCDEHFFWFSNSHANECRQYLMSLMEAPAFRLVDDFDAEMQDGFEVAYSGQLLTDTVIEKATGETVKVVHKYRGMEDIKKWDRVVIERASGEQTEVDMRDINVPYCLASASA